MPDAAKPIVTHQDWQAIFALLDVALELEPASRAAWLAALSPEQAHLSPMLAQLLQAHAARETDDFLRSPASFTVAQEPASAAAAGVIAAGDLIGPYRLLREIGQGGMASVWLAERADGLLERQVALKLPHVSWGAASFAERMARERNILASLAHPNIARLYDAGLAADGRPFLALEYVAGEPIDVHARERRLGVRERVALLVQVARAVAHAHARLVVHRDLKPSNILVDAQGQVHLLDFGIAKLVDPSLAGADDGTQLTQSFGRALTPDYASPEQIRGDAIGTASDIYSLGVVAFELLAGVRPYRLKPGLGAAALADAIAAMQVPLASGVAVEPPQRGALRGDVDAILAKALAKPSAERYPTVDALADDLERHLRGEPVQARPESAWYRADRWVRRHKLETAVGAALVVAVPAGAAAQAAVMVAIGAGAAVALWQMRRARRQAQVAKSEAARAEQVKAFALSLFESADSDAGAGAATTAVDLLQSARRRIEGELTRQPEIATELMTAIGFALIGQGRPDDAASLMEQAVGLATRNIGLEDVRTLAAHVVYGEALVAVGKNREAMAVLKPAVERARRLRDTHAEVEAWRWLSTAQTRDGDVLAGVASAHAAIAALGAVAPGDRRALLDAQQAYGQLATALSHARGPGIADAARKSLEYSRQLHGTRVVLSMLAIRAVLGDGLVAEGQVQAGLRELERAYADTVALVGPSHPAATNRASRLGTTRLEAGDVRGAIEVFRAALEASRTAPGESKLARIGFFQHSLATALSAAREREAALPHFVEAVRLLDQAGGSMAAVAFRSRSAHALALAWLGRLKEAEEAFAGLGAAPVMALEKAAHHGRLAVLRSLQGRHDEAIELARDWVGAVENFPSKTTRAQSLATLGHALLAAGRAAESAPACERAVALFLEAQPQESPDRAEAARALEQARAELSKSVVPR